ncbi:hypothetical protein AURDEDRAFT_69367, partial [Auricularia subglabra TFB-10046 SS5]
PRPSMSTDNARDAALQAEFNEKKWVWVLDEREGYLAGWVTKEEDEVADVVISANSEIHLLLADAVCMRAGSNRAGLDRYGVCHWTS